MGERVNHDVWDQRNRWSSDVRIAFLFIAEAYQVYHGYPVALALAAREDVSVEVFYNDSESPRHFERLATAFSRPQPLATRLRLSFWARLVQALRVFGLAKNATMAANLGDLKGFDAVVAVEKTASWLAGWRDGPRPFLVYIPHGSGDRAVAVQPSIAKFDLVLPTGSKTAQRFAQLGLVRPGGFATTGYIKLEAVERLRRTQTPLFKDRRAIVFYNPHKARGLSSWSAFIEPMLEAFAAQERWALVVAPHVKMFRRARAATRAHWEARSNAHTLIDTGSDRLLDNTYTSLADVYVGDVSSQVYEFLARPRPCVFLNPNRIAWQDDPMFRFWTLGEVVERSEDLMAAINRAPSRHHEFVALQEKLVRDTLGPVEGASETAANAIVQFVRNGRVEPE